MREEPIAGLAIDERSLRLMLLGPDETDETKTVIKIAAEESLPEGVVERGLLKNPAGLAASLQKLTEKTGYTPTYVVLSLPSELTYSKIFYFPKAITGEKLEETMMVTIGFNLPVKPEDVYLDWEKLDTERNELFLATIMKPVADSYTTALEAAGIRTVALESHLASLTRVIDIKTKSPVLLVDKSEKSTAFAILKNGIIRFARNVPKKLGEAELALEIKKISDFYESDDSAIAETIDMDKARIATKFAEHPEIKKKSQAWMASAGAAMRGLLPRGSDTLVSLLPVGTEKAYEFQKGMIFTRFISDVVIGISAFFIIAFLGSWLLIASIGNNLENQVSGLASLPLAKDAIAMEEKALRLNNLSAAVADITKVSPRWSKLFEELRKSTVTGITISSVSISSPSANISINGIGKTRDQMNAFRKTLEDSPVFSDVKLPISNLDKRTDIPFSMSMRLEKLDFLYIN